METDSALGVLRRELGAIGVATTLIDIAREASSGDPFAALDPPWSRRERLSRGQARPAVWLYRALLRRHPSERALHLATAVVAAAGARFIHRGLGSVDGREFERLDPAAARSKVRGWLNHFFTAISYVDDVDPDAGVVSFKVSACALARLSRAAGHPELSGAFCAADNLFFAAQRPPITLDRPTTIAGGDGQCHFRLRFDD